jgi:hypothetical protein
LAGINFNLNPSNAGQITCNDKQILNDGYIRIDLKVGLDLIYEPNASSGFVFSSWTGSIASNSDISQKDKKSSFPFNFLLSFNSDNTAKTTFKPFQNGNLTANFLNPVQVSIPTEALIGIILSPFVGWLIPYIADWNKGKKQSKHLNRYIIRISTISTIKNQSRDQYLKFKPIKG